MQAGVTAISRAEPWRVGVGVVTRCGAHPHCAATCYIPYEFPSPHAHRLQKTQASLSQREMTARRDASRPLSSSRLPERKRAAERAKNNPDCFYPPSRQEPEKGPGSAAGIHAHVVGAVAVTGAADESSDSDAEQEGPQKLIRKVSTSGQIRSKVRHRLLIWRARVDYHSLVGGEELRAGI